MSGSFRRRRAAYARQSPPLLRRGLQDQTEIFLYICLRHNPISCVGIPFFVIHIKQNFYGGLMTNQPQMPINAVLARKTGTHTPLPVMTTRRGHGGRAWSLPLAEPQMRQPQDGSVEKRKRLALIDSKLHSNVLQEPEDARLTGGTRSLTRRLMGLNITEAAMRKRPISNGPSARTDVA